MSKAIFCLKILKKEKMKNFNYNLAKINDLCLVKRSKNMKMSVKKFENKFKIKLPYLSQELRKNNDFYWLIILIIWNLSAWEKPHCDPAILDWERIFSADLGWGFFFISDL